MEGYDWPICISFNVAFGIITVRVRCVTSIYLDILLIDY